MSDLTRNNGETTGRNQDGTFAAGNPGRPKGSRHRTTLAIEELLEGEAETLTRKAVELAKEGDVTALRLCLDRVAPARKDAPVSFEFPPMANANDASQAAQAVLAAVSGGELTPNEAASVMALIETFRRTLELTDIEQRIIALENGQ